MNRDVPPELEERGNDVERALRSLESLHSFQQRAGDSNLFSHEELCDIDAAITHLAAACEAKKRELAEALRVWQHDIGSIESEIAARGGLIDEFSEAIAAAPGLVDALAAGQAARIEKLETARASIGVAEEPNPAAAEAPRPAALGAISESVCETD